MRLLLVPTFANRLLATALVGYCMCQASGCSPSGDAESATPTTTRDQTPSEPKPTAPEDLEIELGPRDLEVDPGNSRDVTIQVTPEGVYEVMLSIIGNAYGAFLDTDRVETDENGQAVVRLTVPLEAPSFVVRATILDKNSELEVEVGRALATVVVEPNYQGGRDVEQWIVTVSSDRKSCPDEDKYVAEGVPFERGEPIEFPDVPATGPVQVFARAKQYVSGCVADVSLIPGVRNVVSLSLSNRPVQLAGLDMDVGLSFDRTPELEGALRTVAATMVNEFRLGSDSDSAALLEAMAVVYGIRAPQEGRARLTDEANLRSWSGIVRRHLSARSEAESPLAATFEEWLTLGVDAVFTTQPFIAGKLISHAEPDAPLASLRLTAVGPLGPDEVNMDSAVQVVLSAAVDDSVSAGFSMSLRPSRLLGGLARTAAGVSALSETALAFAEGIDCIALAEELAKPSLTPEEPLPDCGLACLGQVCDDALVSMWALAEQADNQSRSLEVTVSGDAELDTAAKPAFFGGHWAGQSNLVSGADPIHVGGPFSAKATE